MHNRWMTAAMALLLITGTIAVLAQTDLPPRDDLARLKNALEDAGAAALTSAQESSLQTLIADFRSAHKPSPNSTLQTARTAYEAAILSGNSSAAAAQATVIGNAQAAEIVQRETDAAALAISVLKVLKDGGQWNAVLAKFGSDGAVRLLLSVAGGPGPGGPGFGGRGRGGAPPQGMRRGAPPSNF